MFTHFCSLTVFSKFEISCKNPIANLHQTLQLHRAGLFSVKCLNTACTVLQCDKNTVVIDIRKIHSVLQLVVIVVAQGCDIVNKSPLTENPLYKLDNCNCNVWYKLAIGFLQEISNLEKNPNWHDQT